MEYLFKTRLVIKTDYFVDYWLETTVIARSVTVEIRMHRLVF